jgi:hypothetical protein
MRTTPTIRTPIKRIPKRNSDQGVFIEFPANPENSPDNPVKPPHCPVKPPHCAQGFSDARFTGAIDAR